MTVQVSDRLSQLYVGNGINTRFDFTFRAFEQEDETGIGVRVKVGNDFEFIDESEYTVTFNPDDMGGYVIFIEPPSAETFFYIAGKTPVDQLLDITNYDNFYPDAIELALDKLTAILQEWKHLVDFETQARILADIDYDQLAIQREADLKAYIDGIASSIIGQPVVGLPAKFVIDGDENQEQINDKTIQTIECVADIAGFYPRYNGQEVYLKSWHRGKATGWGYLIYEKNSTDLADDVKTYHSNYGGVWRRKDKKIYAVDAGVLFDNSTDNTEAFYRIIYSLDDYDQIELSEGTARTKSFGGSKTGIVFTGKSRERSKIQLINSNDSIAVAEAWSFRDLSIRGADSNNSILFKQNHNYADLDFDAFNCSFSNAKRVLESKGRGVRFDTCVGYAISDCWVNLDFINPYIPPLPESNFLLEEAMRGFSFNNCRNHYSSGYLLRNEGYNAKNARGFMFSNLWFEGSTRLMIGYGKDVTINNINAYQRTTTNPFMTIAEIEGLTMTGCNYSANTRDPNFPNFGRLIHVSGKVKGVVISGNTFSGMNGELLYINSNNDLTSENVLIQGNIYINCFTSGASIFNLNKGVITGIKIHEKLVSPNSTWLPVKRAAGLTVMSHDIDIKALGSPYVHNFARGASEGSTKKEGMYVGTGAGLTQSILVGYEPKVVKVRGSDGSSGILMLNIPVGLSNGLSIGTSQNFNATAAMNTINVNYFWDSY